MPHTAHAFAGLPTTPPLAKGQAHPQLTPVQAFLQHFGYLAPAAFGPGVLDDPTSAALSLYQQRHRLPITGVFDEATKAQMLIPRCGLPDLDNGIAFSTNCSWPTPQLTFAFEDGTADTIGELTAVRKALATWAATVPVTFTEVARSESPDVAIDWRAAADPDLNMVGSVLAHADFPPACSVVTSGLPKPLHFDDSENAWSVTPSPGTFDIETVALHEMGHILGLRHSDVPGSVMFPSVGDNTTNRALTPDDRLGIQQLYPQTVLTNGTYTVRQKSSGRFLDAHEIESKDFALVTRPAQNNDTQRWTLTQVGTVFVIRQKSSGRFLDAHQESSNDFRVVTRTAQSDASQKWVSMPDLAGSVTLRQLSTRRFLDAHEIESKDFALVTRPAQGNDTQRWTQVQVAPHVFTLRQRSNGRFVDAHEIESKDFLVVTRPNQSNDTQRWILCPVGAVYTITQKSNGRFVDAHEHSGLDFGVVTRPNQNNDTQRWILLPTKDGSFTVQQLSGGRFVDAHDSASDDFRVVTRGSENNDTQRWFFDRV